MRRALAAFALALWVALPGAVRSSPIMEDYPGFNDLHWQTGVRTLPHSHAVVAVPPHARIVLGEDAQGLGQIMGGGDPSSEAQMRVTRVGTIDFQYCDCGYINPDDWGCVDDDEVIASIARYYRKYFTPTVIGWARRPVFDRAHVTITYMLHLRTPEGQDVYEADAIILARGGHETLVASSRKADAVSTWTMLHTGVAAFHLPVGYRFVDWRTGDKNEGRHLAATFAEKAGADDLYEKYSGQGRRAGPGCPA